MGSLRKNHNDNVLMYDIKRHFNRYISFDQESRLLNLHTDEEEEIELDEETLAQELSDMNEDFEMTDDFDELNEEDVESENSYDDGDDFDQDDDDFQQEMDGEVFDPEQMNNEFFSQNDPLYQNVALEDLFFTPPSPPSPSLNNSSFHSPLFERTFHSIFSRNRMSDLNHQTDPFLRTLSNNGRTNRDRPHQLNRYFSIDHSLSRNPYPRFSILSRVNQFFGNDEEPNIHDFDNTVEIMDTLENGTRITARIENTGNTARLPSLIFRDLEHAINEVFNGNRLSQPNNNGIIDFIGDRPRHRDIALTHPLLDEAFDDSNIFNQNHIENPILHFPQIENDDEIESQIENEIRQDLENNNMIPPTFGNTIVNDDDDDEDEDENNEDENNEDENNEDNDQNEESPEEQVERNEQTRQSTILLDPTVINDLPAGIRTDVLEERMPFLLDTNAGVRTNNGSTIDLNFLNALNDDVRAQVLEIEQEILRNRPRNTNERNSPATERPNQNRSGRWNFIRNVNRSPERVDRKNMAKKCFTALQKYRRGKKSNKNPVMTKQVIATLLRQLNSENDHLNVHNFSNFMRNCTNFEDFYNLTFGVLRRINQEISEDAMVDDNDEVNSILRAQSVHRRGNNGYPLSFNGKPYSKLIHDVSLLLNYVIKHDANMVVQDDIVTQQFRHLQDLVHVISEQDRFRHIVQFSIWVETLQIVLYRIQILVKLLNEQAVIKQFKNKVDFSAYKKIDKFLTLPLMNSVFKSIIYSKCGFNSKKSLIKKLATSFFLLTSTKNKPLITRVLVDEVLSASHLLANEIHPKQPLPYEACSAFSRSYKIYDVVMSSLEQPMKALKDEMVDDFVSLQEHDLDFLWDKIEFNVNLDQSASYCTTIDQISFLIETFFTFHHAFHEDDHDDKKFTLLVVEPQKAKKYNDRVQSFLQQNSGIINKLIANSNLSPTIFDQFIQYSRFVNFDNKKNWFRHKLEKERREKSRIEQLKISVRRDNLYIDAYFELHNRPADRLKMPLHVSFRDEPGVDAGGLTREFFQLLSRDMFNPNYALFTQAPNGLYQPNPNSSVNNLHLEYFKFIGQVLAMSLYNHAMVDAYFTRPFYKYILGIPVSNHDIETVDPDLSKNFNWMLNNDITDILDYTFTTPVNKFGERKEIPLKENGEHIPVTNENKHEYVQLRIQYMTEQIRDQLEAFLKGFYELIPRSWISVFTPQELELLISGVREYDFEDLRCHTIYKGYTRDHVVIQWFWKWLFALSRKEKGLFLQFVTGTSKVPLEGFKALQGNNGIHLFTIQCMDEQNRLPHAHTCFNQLDLPSYQSEADLCKFMNLAIYESD
eukprot:CAMPEP_0117430666 /NCGR_PEP_ID=MMETSP0758-20121206/10223_1 /TAXON_ID=63605 /ORGANISM="Percolomonas cosmopolitus, Strain AE-1 (ATCC 50343)" /LENGTH=1326 /DNA_ID=CAMNT_0005218949 /DNA_START=940 /DNA_END=4917 /DNA_ORIENTATION=-